MCLQCAVCLDPLCDGPCVSIDCGHVFHQKCVDGILLNLQLAMRAQCPCCRNTIGTLRKLYINDEICTQGVEYKRMKIQVLESTAKQSNQDQIIESMKIKYKELRRKYRKLKADGKEWRKEDVQLKAENFKLPRKTPSAAKALKAKAVASTQTPPTKFVQYEQHGEVDALGRTEIAADRGPIIGYVHYRKCLKRTHGQAQFKPFRLAPSGQPQFVATLANVLPPRQQTATLVYSNSQQFGTTTGGQRLAVTNSISTQRQVRPLGVQIGGARLPATGLGVRVSNGNISIRGANNIPVLAPSSVLTSLPAGTSTTVTASNLTAVTGLPNARIIQVQQQNPGGAAQILSTGRITGNLMTLHPLVMNASAASSNTGRGTATTSKPSLIITHVDGRPIVGQSSTGDERAIQ